MVWVFLDEHPASVNDGAFAVRMPDMPADTAGQGWADCHAGLQGDSGAFSFVDGHAELRKWREATSTGDNGLGARVTSTSQMHRGNVPNSRDILWLAQHPSALDQGDDPY